LQSAAQRSRQERLERAFDGGEPWALLAAIDTDSMTGLRDSAFAPSAPDCT